jgi:hypothetical protein
MPSPIASQPSAASQVSSACFIKLILDYFAGAVPAYMLANINVGPVPAETGDLADTEFAGSHAWLLGGRTSSLSIHDNLRGRAVREDVQAIPVEFTCAECHHEWPALAGILFEHHSIVCPACGAKREVDVTDLKRSIGAEVQTYVAQHTDSL